MANTQENLIDQQIFKAKSIALSTSATSQVIDISKIKLIGNVTIQIEITGTGTAKVEWSQSNNYNSDDGTGDFVLPVSGFSVVTGFTVTSGTDSDGKDLLNIPMFNSKAFKIIVTETGGANAVVVSAWLSMQ